jgi:type I restriction enzyme, S subunit
MKAGWEMRRLRDIAEYSIGLTYKPKDVAAVGTIVLRSSNIQNDVLDLSDLVRVTCPVKKPLHVRKGDILMCSRNGSKRLVGKTAVIGDLPEEMTFGTFMTVIRSDTNPYLSWFFRSEAFREQLGVGENTMINQVTKYMLDAIRVPIPPTSEQRRIVTILDEAFEGIATAKANAETNLQNARELRDALGEACFDQHIDDSFMSRELASLCELIVDCEHKTAPTQEHGYPSIRTPNIGKGVLILDDVNRVSEETYVAWTRRATPLPGDLILAREAPAGNVAVIPEGTQVCLGQRTVLIRPRPEVFEPEYLAHLLLQRSSQRRLLAHSRGATVQHVNMKDIRAFTIAAVPSLGTQLRVVEELAEIEQSCQSLELAQRQKLAALDELKRSLLHQAFSGALTDKFTDKQVAEVA